jgi:hypothetical protein
MRAPWILAAIMGCGPGATAPRADPRVPAVTPPASTDAPLARPALSFSPWDGVYVPVSIGGAGSNAPAWLVRTLTRGVSIVVGHDAISSTAPTSGGGWKFEMTEGKQTYALALDPPGRDGLPWRVVVDGTNLEYEQRVGALEARVRSRLVVGARFVRLDRKKLGPAGPLDEALTHDAITVMEHGLVRTELPDSRGGCDVDVLIPALDDANRPQASALPPEGALGSVTYILGKIDEGCRGRALDAEAHGIGGGVRFFADAAGAIAGALVIGTMDSELLVAPPISRVDLERMSRATQDNLEHRAE